MRKLINENRVHRMINEELTRADVRSMIDSILDDYLKEKRFSDKVSELTTKAFEKFFQLMYNKRGFWSGGLK